ncbi:hypothetical protein MIZ03_1944 [Rhodoferax lithotrophicus]|uniref:HEPN domain-containing protein n=1 Tax=Rhodoferax lithotrophicus TaxID=2798804 RepID=A0ABM7MLA5_9BURK|nr:HEPN domain-containing protein [Rhodoferax sp. MIZ03]BCO27057.1 hypothetical protein MIZ03_1944 [Rhodoferax sp. MIZ03]
MRSPAEFLAPNRHGFEADPFGYAGLAWTRWAIAQNVAGFNVDPEKPPTSQDLKSPILWLSHAHALSEAAANVIRGEPNLAHLPVFTKGVCHSQYFAVGLMLVGYSLEICLKGMLILRKGIDTYTADERTHKHHDLVRLAEFVPDLDEKDKATLRLLTYYLVWAGRYPDPGSGREDQTQTIFALSERHQIAGKDLFALAARVMGYVRTVVG